MKPTHRGNAKNGIELGEDQISVLLADPEQFTRRLGEHGEGKMCGVFGSCTPHADVFYDYMVWVLMETLRPDRVDAPPIYDRGQFLGWTWSYIGRGLIDLWQATNETRFRTAFIDAARKVMACRDDRYGKIDTIQQRVVKSWGAQFPINGKPERVTDVTVTGLITLPILEFANLLSPSDPDYPEIKGFVEDIAPSMWEFDRFYRYLPEFSAGYYVNMGDARIVEPVSHYAALGAALVELYVFTKKARYLERAVSLHNYMKKATFIDNLGGASLPYMPTPDFPRDFIPEAFWKAAVTHELPLALWRHGLGVTKEEMTGYALAFKTGVFRDRNTLGPLTRFYRTGQFFHLDTGWNDWTPYVRSLVSFTGDAVFLQEFEPGLDLTLSQYMIDYPNWFPLGMVQGAYGPFAKARSYRLKLAI